MGEHLTDWEQLVVVLVPKSRRQAKNRVESPVYPVEDHTRHNLRLDILELVFKVAHPVGGHPWKGGGECFLASITDDMFCGS